MRDCWPYPLSYGDQGAFERNIIRSPLVALAPPSFTSTLLSNALLCGALLFTVHLLSTAESRAGCCAPFVAPEEKQSLARL